MSRAVLKADLDNKEIYDANWASWTYMKVHGPASRWLRFLIQSQLELIPNPNKIRSVLDIGCGEGTATFFLSEQLPNADVLGVDFSKVAIACAQSRYIRKNLKFQYDDELHCLQNRYDMVTAFEVLEHVDDWRNLVRRVALAADRFVMFSLPTGRMRAFERELGHYRNFERGEMERFLAESGFAPVAVFYAGFPFYSPFYREVCNLTYSVSDSFMVGRFGFGRMLLAQIFYALFRLSTKRQFGDQFCGLFARNEPASKSVNANCHL